MKRTLRTLAASALIAAAPMFAAAAPAMSLHEAVAYTQSKFPGEVLIVKYDHSRAENPHYHIDMRFANGAVARLDLDAVNGRFMNVPATSEQSPARMTLRQAVERVKSLIPGQVTFAELDATDRGDPHFHVDLLLDSGHVVWLRVEPNGDLFWRDAVARND